MKREAGSQWIVQRDGAIWEEETKISFPKDVCLCLEFRDLPIEPRGENWEEKARQREETMESLNIFHLEWQKVCSLGSRELNREKLDLSYPASTRPKKAGCQGRCIQRSWVYTRARAPPRTIAQGDTESPRHPFYKRSSQIHTHFQRTSLWIPVVHRSSVARLCGPD